MRVSQMTPTPIGGEKLIIDNTATGFHLTPLKYANAISAYISVEDAPIRFWLNGEIPTSTLGMLLGIGDALELDSPSEIAGFIAIATTVTPANITIIYSA